MRQKNFMVRMFSIDVGKIILEKDNFNGVIDSNKIVSLFNIVFFYDDEGKFFG
jgi:hypothetical protein